MPLNISTVEAPSRTCQVWAKTMTLKAGDEVPVDFMKNEAQLHRQWPQKEMYFSSETCQEYKIPLIKLVRNTLREPTIWCKAREIVENVTIHPMNVLKIVLHEDPEYFETPEGMIPFKDIAFAHNL